MKRNALVVMDIKYLYYSLLVFLLLVLLIRIRRLQDKHIVFIILLMLVIVVQVMVDLLKWKKINHYFLFHIYVPLEYILLSIYYISFPIAKKYRRLIFVSNIFLIVFYLLYYQGDRLKVPDFIGFALEMVLVSGLVISFFIGLFNSEEEIKLFDYPDFWINTGNLFFYTGCMFVMGLHYSLLEKNPSLAKHILAINHYLNIILYLLYSIAFLCPRARS